ncbi:MAG: TRAP transporter small permease [Halanaerobiales bacterium]|nr:TRAP transporter small permease [Halanaerobiales bacterium]
MDFLEKLNNIIRKLEEFILAYGVLTMAALTIINVISRNFFNHGLSFATEINEFLIVFITFLGTSYAARNGRHIRMSALFDIANKKIKKIMVYIMTGGTALIMYYVTYLSAIYVYRVFLNGRMSPVMRVPLYLIWIFVPIGLLMTDIHYTLAFIKNIIEDDVWISFEEQSEYEDLETAMRKDQCLKQ